MRRCDYFNTYCISQETPFEAMQRRMAEKKKARKLAKKQAKMGTGALSRESSGEGSRDEEGSAANNAELELLMTGDGDVSDEKNFDMRALVRAEKDRLKGRKGKKKT
jgi:hypothetical protein